MRIAGEIVWSLALEDGRTIDYVATQCAGETSRGERCRRLGSVPRGDSYRCGDHPRPRLSVVRGGRS